MIDVDAAITSELERLTPVTAEPDWVAVAHAAGLDRRLPRPRSGRQVVAVAIAALVIAGASVAAVKEAPWWKSGAPAVDPQAVASVAALTMKYEHLHVDVARARTVAEDGDAALVAVPLGATGYCLVPVLEGHSVQWECQMQVVDPVRGDDDWAVTLPNRADGRTRSAWLVYGRITDPRAATFDLGSLTLALEPGGFFLAEIPESRWTTLAGTANVGSIRDAAGTPLRLGCVNWGPSPLTQQAGTPSLPLFETGGGACAAQQAHAPPRLDLTHAAKLVELTLARDSLTWKEGATLALWRAAAADGTACVWIAAAAPAPAGTSPGAPGAPSNCDNLSPPANTPPLQLLIANMLSGGLVAGRVSASAGIVKVVLRSESGSTVLPLRHGWFIGQLRTASPGSLFVLTGYAAGGGEVAQARIPVR